MQKNEKMEESKLRQVVAEWGCCMPSYDQSTAAAWAGIALLSWLVMSSVLAAQYSIAVNAIIMFGVMYAAAYFIPILMTTKPSRK